MLSVNWLVNWLVNALQLRSEGDGFWQTGCAPEKLRRAVARISTLH